MDNENESKQTTFKKKIVILRWKQIFFFRDNVIIKFTRVIEAGKEYENYLIIVVRVNAESHFINSADET